MTETPKLKAIVPYFGGKRTLAQEVVAELGPHAAYWEPFCGSLAVLLAKPPSGHETVNDLHSDLVNLARVIASDAAGTLYQRLIGTLMCEGLFETARERVAGGGDDDPVDRAYWYFITSWMGRNGVAGTKRYNCQLAVRWTPHGGAGGLRFANAVDSIPAWHRRLRRVLILQRNAFELIPKIVDVAGVAVYVDPPYLAESRSGLGKAKYEHDFAADDHERLAELLRRFQHARVVVSYYDAPSLGMLYPGWTQRKLVANKNLHVQNRRGSTKTAAPEVLLLNGPSLVADSARQGTLGFAE